MDVPATSHILTKFTTGPQVDHSFKDETQRILIRAPHLLPTAKVLAGQPWCSTQN
ncbi:MAG: hypothetical protein QM650_08230 [Microlunatus sp.]